MYLLKRDIRIFILAIMVLGVLYMFHQNGMIEKPGSVPMPNMSHDVDYVPDCQLPSAQNPMANVLLSDYTEDPDRPPACYYPTVEKKVKRVLDDTIPYDCGRSRCSLPKYQRNAAARQFVSMPVSTIPGAQTAFAEWCYGKKYQPQCRDDPSKCSPNARGVQLEAFGGLDRAGDKRSGMTN